MKGNTVGAKSEICLCLEGAAGWDVGFKASGRADVHVVCMFQPISPPLSPLQGGYGVNGHVFPLAAYISLIRMSTSLSKELPDIFVKFVVTWDHAAA